MRRTILTILAVALALTSGAAVEPASSADMPSLTVPETADQTESAAPMPSPQPTQTPAAQPTAIGADVFADPDDCTNPEGGYRVAYPGAWYSNAKVPDPLNPAAEGFAACQLFAPTDFDVAYGTDIPGTVDILIRVEEVPEGTGWNYEPFAGHRILTDSVTTVGDQPARVREIEVTDRNVSYRLLLW